MFAGQTGGQLLGIAYGRGAQDEIGTSAVPGADTGETTEKLADVRAEHAPIGVGFVHDHERQGGEEGGPLLMVGQDGEMQHFRVGDEHAGRIFAYLAPEVVGSVAVVDGCRRACGFRPVGGKSGEGRQLVLSQRLEREEHQDTAVAVLQVLFKNGQTVAERLAAGCGRGDNEIASGAQDVCCRCLVAVQRGNALFFQYAGHGPGPGASGFAVYGGARRVCSVMGHLTGEAFRGQQGGNVVRDVVPHGFLYGKGRRTRKAQAPSVSFACLTIFAGTPAATLPAGM